MTGVSPASAATIGATSSSSMASARSSILGGRSASSADAVSPIGGHDPGGGEHDVGRRQPELGEQQFAPRRRRAGPSSGSNAGPPRGRATRRSAAMARPSPGSSSVVTARGPGQPGHQPGEDPARASGAPWRALGPGRRPADRPSRRRPRTRPWPAPAARRRASVRSRQPRSAATSAVRAGRRTRRWRRSSLLTAAGGSVAVIAKPKPCRSTVTAVAFTVVSQRPARRCHHHHLDRVERVADAAAALDRGPRGRSRCRRTSRRWGRRPRG